MVFSYVPLRIIQLLLETFFRFYHNFQEMNALFEIGHLVYKYLYINIFLKTFNNNKYNNRNEYNMIYRKIFI